MFSIFLRYGLMAILSVTVWNTALNKVPFLYILDKDKREIVSLTKEKAELNIKYDNLVIVRDEQNNQITLLNEQLLIKESTIVKIVDEGKIKINKLSKQIENVNKEVQIDTCQDGIDFILRNK